ncbi:hypothetical protein [Streptomyces sp. NPDC047028]|uniref:hypothetical protein n=1 Tax=Streptomyces sp. NPDC047028 TaxID=3155793 RepID=UPI0033F2160F
MEQAAERRHKWPGRVKAFLREVLEPSDTLQPPARATVYGTKRTHLTPWLVTFRLVDGTLHSYVITDARNADQARWAARRRADTPLEHRARQGISIDSTYEDVWELTSTARWGSFGSYHR